MTLAEPFLEFVPLNAGSLALIRLSWHMTRYGFVRFSSVNSTWFYLALVISTRESVKLVRFHRKAECFPENTWTHVKGLLERSLETLHLILHCCIFITSKCSA